MKPATLKNKTVHVFDLDGTVIDSFHRVKPCLKENGDLDLTKYITEACTYSKVMGDTLLPLADTMLGLIKAGKAVAICTARTMFKHDYVFLRKNGLKVPFIMSRDKCRNMQHYKMTDSEYKSVWLNKFKEQHENTDFVLYDDNPTVLEMAEARVDVIAKNAVKWNEFLARLESKPEHYWSV